VQKRPIVETALIKFNQKLAFCKYINTIQYNRKTFTSLTTGMH